MAAKATAADQEKLEKKLEINKKFLQQLDDIKLRVQKGYREEIQDRAKKEGMSVNVFFINAINKTYDMDIPTGIKDKRNKTQETDS